ncbi:MAG: sulfurtransferase TusA family protein [Chloroflexi bacterium]|nr:sulfurtransferase TusA family protein [Chloroflexota bacterium]
MNHVETVDARGLSCPQPVILARKALEAAGKGTVKVRVDSGTSRDNVSRMARGLGWRVEITQEGDEFLLTLSKE